MAVESPLFPILKDWDYGYFQVLEESRKHELEMAKSTDSIQSKLQKSMYKDDLRKTQKSKKKKWWNNALFFLKGSSIQPPRRGAGVVAGAFRASVSGPLYIAYGRTCPSKTYRTTRTPSSGPSSGGITPPTRSDLQIPYLNLRDLKMEEERRSFTSRLPIYFVT